jgi:hypothetical protein
MKDKLLAKFALNDSTYVRTATTTIRYMHALLITCSGKTVRYAFVISASLIRIESYALHQKTTPELFAEFVISFKHPIKFLLEIPPTVLN